jgi:GNAT superfamily N-acetyltransferase
VRPAIRDGTSSDHAVLARIGAEGGSPDGDDAYFSFVGMHGRLLVAHDGTQVVGFVGTVPIGAVTMVTDLFVRRSARGDGVGRHLLRTALRGSVASMTFSSTHPAALALYASMGMAPQARVLTMRGTAVGGGPALRRSPWRHDRPELIEYFGSVGAEVCSSAVVHQHDTGATVLRLMGDDPQAVETEVLAALGSGTPVEVSVIESNPIAAVLRGHGFVEIDHDLFCATDPGLLPGSVRCVHRGLG